MTCHVWFFVTLWLCIQLISAILVFIVIRYGTSQCRHLTIWIFEKRCIMWYHHVITELVGSRRIYVRYSAKQKWHYVPVHRPQFTTYPFVERSGYTYIICNNSFWISYVTQVSCTCCFLSSSVRASRICDLVHLLNLKWSIHELVPCD